MSKLNVNELEANGTNSNLKIVTKSTGGVCEITGADNDATLQLNCSAQSHGVKLKVPPDSANQNYTLSLPDNQIAASKLLKVKSVTGSGATTAAQLEFADAPPNTYTNIQAPNINNGTFNSARLGNFSATQGGSLKLINKTEVASGVTPSSISFTGLEDNAHYLIRGKDVVLPTDRISPIRITFLGADGNLLQTPSGGTQYVQYTARRGISGSGHFTSIGSTTSIDVEASDFRKRFVLSIDLFTEADYVYMFLRGHINERAQPSNNSAYPPYPMMVVATLYQPAAGTRIHGIKLDAFNTTYVNPTQFLLYQYMDS